MHVVAKLITSNGEILMIRPKKGDSFTLEELQRYVDGNIQICTPPGKSGAILVVNEEGKVEGLPVNELASAMWQELAEPGSERSFDDVVGDVVLCHTSQIE